VTTGGVTPAAVEPGFVVPEAVEAVDASCPFDEDFPAHPPLRIETPTVNASNSFVRMPLLPPVEVQRRARARRRAHRHVRREGYMAMTGHLTAGGQVE
jgi:hypothetical protein